jgi:hypothetical protein
MSKEARPALLRCPALLFTEALTKRSSGKPTADTAPDANLKLDLSSCVRRVSADCGEYRQIVGAVHKPACARAYCYNGKASSAW